MGSSRTKRGTSEETSMKAQLVQDLLTALEIIVKNSNRICESCQVFRKSLLTMLSNQNAKQSQFATSANSHCTWKYLSTEEAQLHVKNLREERQKMTREISDLKQRFQKVFY